MANRKLFNSKNIAQLLEALINNGEIDLVVQLLKTKELKNLSPNIVHLLKKKNLKLEDYKLTKIYSKTEISEKVLSQISTKTGIDTSGSKIVIDPAMGAGVKIKSRSRLIDASLATMLQKGLEELLAE